METFEINVEYDAEPDRVMAAFWDLEDWPAVAPHVRAIDMLYGDDQAQVLIMQVATKQKLDAFKSVRIKQRDTIFYFQPAPPPLLRTHYGSWRFVATTNGTTVISQHTVDINTDAARSFLGNVEVQVQDAGGVQQQVINLIRNNSLQTMLALKKRLEQTNGGTYA